MLINDIINEVQDDGKPRKIRGQELNDEVAQELDDEIGPVGSRIPQFVNVPTAQIQMIARGLYLSGPPSMTIGKAVKDALKQWTDGKVKSKDSDDDDTGTNFSSANMGYERPETKLKRGWNQSTHRNKADPDIKIDIPDIVNKIPGVKQAKAGRQMGSKIGQSVGNIIAGRGLPDRKGRLG